MDRIPSYIPILANAIVKDTNRVHGTFDNLFPREQKELLDACKFIINKCEKLYNKEK